MTSEHKARTYIISLGKDIQRQHVVAHELYQRAAAHNFAGVIDPSSVSCKIKNLLNIDSCI